MLMAETLIHNLRVEPYDYQKEGILAGLRWHRFLIGDEPGLGKTLQSIGVVDCSNALPLLGHLSVLAQNQLEAWSSRSLPTSTLLCSTTPCLPHGRTPPQNGYAAGGGRQLRVSA